MRCNELPSLVVFSSEISAGGLINHPDIFSHLLCSASGNWLAIPLDAFGEFFTALALNLSLEDLRRLSFLSSSSVFVFVPQVFDSHVSFSTVTCVRGLVLTPQDPASRQSLLQEERRQSRIASMAGKCLSPHGLSRTKTR